MTDVAVGLPLIGLVAFVLGAGWATVFRRVAPFGVLGFVFLAWACAIASTSLVWAWVYPLNQNVRVGTGALFGFAVAGYIVALWRSSFRQLDFRNNLSPIVGIVVATVVTLVAILPAVADGHHLTLGNRIGPDGVGYAIAADAIGNGLTKGTIEYKLSSQLVGGTVQTALTPKTEQVDKIPSFTIQVQNEFLTGADRWGLAGAAGSVIYLFGDSHLWAALTLLTAFALLTTCVGLWICVRAVSGSAWAATASTILFGLSSSVLNSWHEGGLAQIWVMPAFFLLVLPIVRLQDNDRFGLGAAAAIGVAGLLPAYNSGVVAYAAIFGVAMVLSLAVVGRTWWRSWWPIVLGVVCGGTAVFPSTAAFATTVARSLSENGISGWPLPRWLSVSDSFGLANVYNSPHPVLEQRGAGELVVGGIENAVVGGLLLGVVYRIRLRMSVVLMASVFIVVGFVYLQSRYLHPTTNYQYFKAIVAAAPAGALGFGVMLGEALTQRARTSGVLTRRNRRPRTTGLLLASAAVMLCVTIAGCDYVVTFRSQGSVVPVAFTDLAGSNRAQTTFDHYNVISPGGFPAIAVAAEVNLNWIGRFGGTPATRLSGRVSRPVALMITEEKCPKFACLKRLQPGTVVLKQGGVALVRLSDTTVALAQMNESAWPQWVSTRFTAIGGGQLVELIPVGSSS
jgi:hypothetical protein